MPSTLAPRVQALLAALPNERTRRFVQEYVVDFNGTQAAIRAGYAAHAAPTQAAKLLKKAHISACVHALVQPVAEELQLTAHRVMKEVAMVAFFDPIDAFDEDGRMKKIRDMPADVRRNIKAYDRKTGKVFFNSKNEALSLAARITKIVEQDAPPDITQFEQLAAQHFQLPPHPTTIIAGTHTNGSTHGNGVDPHANGNGNGSGPAHRHA
jgi:phage terminase small subunit